jgi:hypothetical protein
MTVTRWVFVPVETSRGGKEAPALMTIQAFVDDSGHKGTNRHFVLAGLVGSSASWAEFSDEWRAVLEEYPAIRSFKMKEAAGRPSGQFRGMTDEQRDDKLRALARVINRHPKVSTFSMIDLDVHAETWATLPKPHSEPYFWPYQNTIMAVCHELWDSGSRERFEIIYDEDVIFGPRARLWYPAIKRLMEIQFPEQATILPIDPMFKSDDEFLPIQAADMFAWCARNSADKQDPDSFSWLRKEMPRVRGTEYSQYYDGERLRAVMAETQRLLGEKSAPKEFVDVYASTLALMKRR